MRRFSQLLISMAVAAGLLLPPSPVAAATTVNFRVAGTASAAIFPQVSMAGVALSESRSEFGVWNAVLSSDLGAITSGTFTFKSKIRTFEDTIVGGTFGGGFGSPAGTCAKTTIPVRALLDSGGSLDVTLTRYGFLRNGSCVVYFSTVLGTATLIF